MGRMFATILLRGRRVLRHFRVQYRVILLLVITCICISKWQHKKPKDVYIELSLLTEGCKIPYLPYFDEEFKQYDYDAQALRKKCPANTWIFHNDTHIWTDFKKDPLKFSKVTCCYEPFYKSKSIDISKRELLEKVDYGPCIYINDYTAIKIKHDFVRVTCKYIDRKNRIKEVKKFIPSLSSDKEYQLPTKPDIFEVYYVVVLGIEGMSKLNFYRTMSDFFEALSDNGAVELGGHCKTAGDTFENLMPLLLGRTVADMRKTCWPQPDSWFDNCPFIWQHFKKLNFTTSFADECNYIFHYFKRGFLRSPTDLYYQPFAQEAMAWHANLTNICTQCIGNEQNHEIFMNYTQKSISFYSRFFGFYWLRSMSFKYHNLPELIQFRFYKFFRRLLRRFFDKIIIIVTSDRGANANPFRYSRRGRHEERLPLATVAFPPAFQEYFSYAYRNFVQNSNRLTTHFDMFATLQDLANLSMLYNDNILKRSQENYWQNRSISLFLPVPENRTCELAGIPEQYCPCTRGSTVKTNDTVAIAAGKFIVSKVNINIWNHKECMILEYGSVAEASILRTFYNGGIEYKVVVLTSPVAEFYARVMFSKKVWSLTSAISRTDNYDLYRPYCVNDDDVKQYCICKSELGVLEMDESKQTDFIDTSNSSSSL